MSVDRCELDAWCQSPGLCATLACLWEATAAKPGNVHRGADFEDVSYADFVTSAAVIGPVVDRIEQQGVGRTIRLATVATRSAVASNTNLGMLLLIVPLAAVPTTQRLSDGIDAVLAGLTAADTAEVYEAIRLAQPGGLGEVDEADVAQSEPPSIPLVEAMRMAAERDSIARQYVNRFDQVFQSADRIERWLQQGEALGESIVSAYVELLAELPDTLIARKCGVGLARETSQRAAVVMAAWDTGVDGYRRALADFDFWLRSDRHRRNPGTTADLIAGGLFVLLREGRIDWPTAFYSVHQPSSETAS